MDGTDTTEGLRSVKGSEERLSGWEEIPDPDPNPSRVDRRVCKSQVLSRPRLPLSLRYRVPWVPNDQNKADDRRVRP